MYIKNCLIVSQTVADVSPTMESTGAESNEDSDIFPSQFGLGILVFARVGIKCTTNAVVSLDTSSCKIKQLKRWPGCVSKYQKGVLKK